MSRSKPTPPTSSPKCAFSSPRIVSAVPDAGGPVAGVDPTVVPLATAEMLALGVAFPVTVGVSRLGISVRAAVERSDDVSTRIVLISLVIAAVVVLTGASVILVLGSLVLVAVVGFAGVSGILVHSLVLVAAVALVGVSEIRVVDSLVLAVGRAVLKVEVYGMFDVVSLPDPSIVVAVVSIGGEIVDKLVTVVPVSGGILVTAVVEFGPSVGLAVPVVVVKPEVAPELNPDPSFVVASVTVKIVVENFPVAVWRDTVVSACPDVSSA